MTIRLPDVEAPIAERAREVLAGLRRRVGDQAERDTTLAQAQPFDRSRQRLPGDGEHAVDVQQQPIDRHDQECVITGGSPASDGPIDPAAVVAPSLP